MVWGEGFPEEMPSAKWEVQSGKWQVESAKREVGRVA